MAITVDAIKAFRTIEGDQQSVGVRKGDTSEGGRRGRVLEHLLGSCGRSTNRLVEGK